MPKNDATITREKDDATVNCMFQVLEGLTRPCEEDWARNDFDELNLVSFFETWLYERDQTFFTDQITILVLKKFSIDANMVDEMLLRALANGSGSDLKHLHIGRVIYQHPRLVSVACR